MAATTTKPLNFLITGAGRGIGRGLSRRLVQRGHRVFLVDNDAAELASTYEIISQSLDSKAQAQAKERPFETFHCNLRHRGEIERAARDASVFFAGHLDVLVNNAAYTAGVGGHSLTAAYPGASSGNGSDSRGDDFADGWDASVETNLTAPVLLSRACLPMLRREPPRRLDGGCIVHVSSTRAHQSEPDSEAYAATKAGLVGLTHSMAVSLAAVGVRVNAILPGWIHVADERREADRKGTKWEEGLTAEDHKWHLSGRVGMVDDVLAAVEYLANAKFVTGTETVVDGGVTRKMVYPE